MKLLAAGERPVGELVTELLWSGRLDGQVWRALTEERHLAAWSPTTIEGELKPGAPLRFSSAARISLRWN